MSPFDSSVFRLPPLPKASALRVEAAGILEPPPDIDVAEAAERYRHLNNPGGGYSGPWRNVVVPYLVGPMRALTDPRYPIVVNVAPAQSAKSECGLNYCGYSIEVDPADFQIILPEKQLAEDFSERRLDRLVDASPHYAARLVNRKMYLSRFDRCLVNLSWPTSSNASSKPVPRNWLDEVDSMPDDVGGEGSPVMLYHKRSQTFGPRRKTLATSSPKRLPIKGAPAPVGPHEMPAAKGITSLYNQGTRRLFYWPCRECGTFFVTRARDVKAHEKATSNDRDLDVWFGCPTCGAIHGEADRRGLWARGEWIAEGQTIDERGVIFGDPRHTEIDSYWLFGPQAAFISLEELVRKRLAAEEDRERTGSDSLLRTWTNVDAGEHFFGETADEAPRAPEALQASAPDLPLGVVPAWAEVVVAAVDVQSDRFEIGWGCFGPGNESALLDVQKLIAVTSDGQPVLAGGGAKSATGGSIEQAEPAERLEHWFALVAAVLDKPLPLEADPTKGLTPQCVAIDTGGKAGVTDKAYKFARWLRRNRPDLVPKVMFVKGRGGRNPLRIRRDQWDAKVTSRRTVNRRGVDLWNLWVNELKDALDARLRKAIKSSGARGSDTTHVSRNLPEAVFAQLCAETRDEEGEWQNVRQVKNEAWDLCVYMLAVWIRLGGEKIDWAKPPRWARAIENAMQIAAPPATPAQAAKPKAEPATPMAAPERAAPAARRGFAPRRGGGSWLNGWR